MNVLVCNERFLFRFGADRVLLLLARHLRESGHCVTLLGCRFDDDSRTLFGPQIQSLPADDVEYQRLDDHAVQWVSQHWERLVERGGPPDLAVVGGWPFHSALPFLKKRCAVVVIDFGAVPLTGYSGHLLEIQHQLRDLRRRHLKEASLIFAISRFIQETQSVPDSQHSVPVRTLLLGADHIEWDMWHGRQRSAPAAIDRLEQLKREGKRLVLSLGRWEPGSYKNSEAALELITKVRHDVPGAVVLVLADATEVAIPRGLEDAVVPLGRPGDGELRALMQQADLGVSPSLWEGFNLPLAEMQWLGCPVLVFDVAAHAEVIADRAYLCRDLGEMAEKAVALLTRGDEPPALSPDALARFRTRFVWRRVFQDFDASLRELMPAGTVDVAPLRIVTDVSHAARDPANSGVVRVTRRVAAMLQEAAAPVFGVWDADAQTYLLPTEHETRQLSAFTGPVLSPREWSLSATRRTRVADVLRDAGGGGPSWLLLTEAPPASHVRGAQEFAQHHGLRVAALFYDAIPVFFPELCPDPQIRENHGAYMRQLARCEVVVPISEYSGRCLEDYWRREGISGCPVVPIQLPGEFGASSRVVEVEETPPATTNILCVSTLEPRKNHRTLIQACLGLAEKYPRLEWSLALVGNRYAGASDIAETVTAVCREHPRIRWLGVVDDATLSALYRDASFTVYPSVVEGFGMPIVESLWHGRPCICSGDGVMGELAAGGGCLTVDVHDELALSDAIGRLATDHALRRKLAAEAVQRPIKTWREYGAEVCSLLAATAGSTWTPNPSAATSTAVRTWSDILFPGCLLKDWQQNESERLAMTAVLARHRPRCSIEVGTYRGGSLSLLAQYSQVVFSIDIDPSVKERLVQFRNVSFLTGPSAILLPMLLQELADAGMAVDFVLIDGDHSEAGVRSDIECVLASVPRAPLFVMIHDSFNPGCRRGILGASWTQSPYVHWIDVDFVPGRIIEHGDDFQGEMWGGLALAYLAPVAREGELTVTTSAQLMFEKLRDLQYPAERRRDGP